MNLEFSHYRLPLRCAPNARTGQSYVEGILVRRDGGYGCLQTWPSLGERSWQDEWSYICKGDWSSPVASRLDACLSLDAEARRTDDDLFEGLELPESYLSIASEHRKEAIDAANELGFRGGKLKGFAPLDSMMDRLEYLHQCYPQWCWRLDFNGMIDPEVLTEWCDGLSDGLKACLAYIEDPCSSSHQWPEIHGLKFAEDRCFDRGESSHLRIVKPAIVDWRELEQKEALILTSNFQHPLGLLFDWWEAAQALRAGVRLLKCGLVTQHIFVENPWSEALGPLLPNPSLPSGAGLGLGDLLEKQEWVRV